MSTRPRKPGPATPAPGKLPLTELAAMKRRGTKIVMVTAYDAPGGRFADEAGVDIVLVGDSAAMTVLGHDVDRPRDDGRDARADARGHARRARPLVVADMPFGSFQVSDESPSRTRSASSRTPAPTPSSSRAPARCSPARARSSAPASR